jgi:hypothetical protein
VVVGALEQDDHVLLSCVISNPVDQATTVNRDAFESIEWNIATVFDKDRLGDGNAGDHRAKFCH